MKTHLPILFHREMLRSMEDFRLLMWKSVRSSLFMVEWSQEHEVLDEHQEHHDDITQEHLDLGDFMDEIQILKDRKM